MFLPQHFCSCILCCVMKLNIVLHYIACCKDEGMTSIYRCKSEEIVLSAWSTNLCKGSITLVAYTFVHVQPYPELTSSCSNLMTMRVMPHTKCPSCCGDRQLRSTNAGEASFHAVYGNDTQCKPASFLRLLGLTWQLCCGSRQLPQLGSKHLIIALNRRLDQACLGCQISCSRVCTLLLQLKSVAAAPGRISWLGLITFL